jgi:nitrilase
LIGFSEAIISGFPDWVWVVPNGEFIVGPSENKEEILYAEIDLGVITKAKRMFDVTGHYARPDVFKVPDK